MTFNKYILLIAICILGGFSACKKDLGNYNYDEINQLSSVNGIASDITAIYGKQFVLKPELKFTQDAGTDESKYSYEWSYIGPNGLGGSKLFTLATTRNLDLKMTIVAGSYSFYYAVTDKNTGVKFRYPFTLKVVNEINEGWMLMCDVSGKARVDMLSLNTSGDFDLVTDLLATTGSDLKLDGKPVMTYTYSTGLLIGPDAISYGVYFGTDKSTQKVDPNTFKWTKTMGLTYEMFGNIPEGFYADVIKQRGGGASYMIGKGDAYYYERVQNIYYSAPINYIAIEQKGFKVAPFIAGNPQVVSNAHAIFYDITNRRFVKHAGTSATCTTLPDPPDAQKLFSFTTGMDLTYMQWVAFNGGEVFSILKDPNSTKRYLARFNSANNAQSYYSEILATDFANAEQYAISPDLGYIFYNVGAKVYEYDMSLKTTKLMLDMGAKKISLLQFYEFKSTTKYKDSNKLMVGSYDAALTEGQNGSLGIYTVPPVNGDLVLYKNYSGFGKVKSITYRER
ncbi:PKD-like family lipoprotein [Pedobacter soli]|uniref:PKD-like family protein n=1 Tax=Pedobacter soli TaxID=390242 RepID=A0A1G6QI06_9SPHI|nr:PKD-like family lipoprotein [Pedobacter soli]SDC91953.1 PKD-like family protein [Pedobacter soli]